nr:Multidrug resistance-associated protein 1 [Polyrhizophydium stewartii]
MAHVLKALRTTSEPLRPIRRDPVSLVTVSWLTPILRHGARKPLAEADLPDLPSAELSSAAAASLDGFRRRLGAHIADPAAARAPSLASALAKTHAAPFTAAVLLRSAAAALAILRPLMIPQILRVLLLKSNPAADTSSLWTTSPVAMAFIMLAMEAASGLFLFTAQSVILGMNVAITASASDLIYKKALFLSPKARQQFTEGTISTLSMTDVRRLAVFASSCILAFACIAQTAAALVSLVKFLGVSTWIAVGIYVSMMLVQTVIVPGFGVAISNYMSALDARTKALREFLYGVKVIKYQAAEEAFVAGIGKLRALQCIGLVQYIKAFSMLVSVSILQQFLIPPLTIIIYAALGGSITADTIFTAMGLLSALIDPSGYIFGAAANTYQGYVSYKRITEFLVAEQVKSSEITQRQPSTDSHDGTAIKMSAASFTWEEVKKNDPNAANGKSKRRIFKKKSKKAAVNADADKKDGDAESDKPAPFALQDITLDIPRGSLVAVVGSVGSGKSSFLSALIGGMRKTAGDSALFGSVAYCAQEPWILTGTVEENIVFGNDAVRARIPAAIAAACLDHDLEILPNGLGTQIGEKGINLSGGQKARVALARAIARDADIYLLDDPIAALDAHVGKKVFDDAICGVLRGKTVVLVTHQLHLLPKVDTVVVLDEGRVVETGAFRELMAREDGALAEIMKDYHFDDAEAETAKEADDDADANGDKPEDIVKAVKAFEEEKAVAEDRRVVLFAILVIASVLIYRFYQRSYREIKRLSSIMRSPVASHISESLTGIPTILSFGLSERFIGMQHSKMDANNKANFILSSAQIWLGVRLSLLSSLAIFAVLMLAAFDLVNAAVVGLGVSMALSLGDGFNHLLTTVSEAEAMFNSVERLDYYAKDLPAEAARELPTDPKDGEWPTAGAVAISSLEIRYPSRPDHAVIQDLSLDIQPGEKVGVVGRTGSGKSTLMTALFRIMEASKGSIAIDGIDIASLGLKTLRSRLQIIPQDPVLFKGTVRSNPDFATKYTDDELWAALGLVGLKDFVGSLDGKLDAAIDENGANLSMGQRQLMCLCKAILAKPKVLIMDEATASVDAEADKRIQESIETQFAATTVLSIAHRLNTIAAFDRVLVLDGGRIAEFDAPHVLLGRAGSVFGDMVEATGAANAAVIRQIAADQLSKTH